MQKFTTLADAVRIAELAHFNQTDKAGLPYIEHPRRVMQAVQTQGAYPFVQMAAILHDVTEDTAFTCAMLLDLGIPEAAVEIVRLVDRGASRRMFHALNPNFDGAIFSAPEVSEFYYNEIKKNPGAVQVKLADIGDNLQPWRLSYLPAAQQDKLQRKYATALNILNS